MYATMEHGLIVKPHTVSILAVMSPKMMLLYWFVWRKYPGAISVTYFHMVVCAGCAKVVNKPIKVFCMHTSYVIILGSYKSAITSWKHCIWLGAH